MYVDYIFKNIWYIPHLEQIICLKNKSLELIYYLNKFNPYLKKSTHFTVSLVSITPDVKTTCKYPWKAAIYVAETYKCAGSIICKNWILTSASCVDG